MQLPTVKSICFTSNIYVQRQIVRDNKARLNNYIASQEYSNLPMALKDDLQKLLDAQSVLACHLNDLIRKVEEGAFSFGL